MSAAHTSAILGRRACAVLAASSAALHAVMLGQAANIAIGVLMAAMIIACLYCARDLWLRGTLGVWCVVALMNLAMIALHLPAPAHHHGAAAPTSDPSTITAAATLVAMVEVAAAAVVLYYRTRRRVALSGRPAR